VPSQIIDSVIPTTALLVHVLVAKYQDHLPLVRLAKSLFQLFKENPTWILSKEPPVPLEVAYLDVRYGVTVRCEARGTE
jgi:hypothetical protein